MHSKRHPVRGAISKAKIARNMRSKRHPVRGAISKAKIRWKKNSLSPNVCPNVVALSENVTSNNVAPKCGVRHKCGGSPKCGVKQCGVKMWRQTLPLPNCLPRNVSSKKVFSGRHKSTTLNACALMKKNKIAMFCLSWGA